MIETMKVQYKTVKSTSKVLQTASGGYRAWWSQRASQQLCHRCYLSTDASSRISSSSLPHKILDYGPYLSTVSSLRKPSAIRRLMPLMSKPGMVSLGGGLPNPNLFPFRSLRFSVGDIDKNGKSSDMIEDLELSDEELGIALQYSPTPGVPELVRLLGDLQQREHGVDDFEGQKGDSSSKSWDYSISVTTGSQDGLCKAFEMLLDPHSDDELFVESPTYSGALAFLHPYGCKLVPVPTDEHGLQPEYLSQVLEESSSSSPGEDGQKKKRRVLYTIPTAQNPSGSTLSNDRRVEVYHLARQHDLIILEDDPYYFLHADRQSIDSFLSLDNYFGDGRVLRLDSFSKLLSSGMRVGFVTGPPGLVNQINLHSQATNLHASGVSQLLVQKLLEYWGVDGFNSHAESTAEFYKNRREILVSAADKNLRGLAEWNVPEAGMFLWIKLLNRIDDTKSLIEEKAADANVLFVPGQSFCPMNMKSPYVRASFSTASDDDIHIAMERLAALIRNETTN